MLMPPLIPLMPTMPSGPLLTSEQLRSGLEACGYRCSTVSLPGTHSVPPGCTLVLQFGDALTSSEDGACCLTIRCSVQINGRDECVSNVTSWRIRKTFPFKAGEERLSIDLDLDLILGRNIALSDLLAHDDDVYQHLQSLADDARGALRAPSIGRRGSPGTAAVVRIEARFLGDLAAGRSGLATAGGDVKEAVPSSVAAVRLRMLGSACDHLAKEILPDMASAIRHIALQARAATSDSVGRVVVPARVSASSQRDKNPVQTATQAPIIVAVRRSAP